MRGGRGRARTGGGAEASSDGDGEAEEAGRRRAGAGRVPGVLREVGPCSAARRAEPSAVGSRFASPVAGCAPRIAKPMDPMAVSEPGGRAGS